MHAVAFLPIRLNSKRVTAKSIRPLGGRPLFCWLLQELDQLGIPVHIYCSAPDIIRPLVDFPTRHVIFTRRPEHLDGDDVKGIDIYRQFAADVPSAAYLLTHCTSPFIRAGTLRKVLDPVVNGEATCALTVRRIQSFLWFDGAPLNFSLPRIQTQRLEPAYVETSAAYCYRTEILSGGDRSDLHPKLVELGWPEEEDIDYEADFARCEALVPLVRSAASQ